MITISILCALVICLFRSDLDSPDEQGIYRGSKRQGPNSKQQLDRSHVQLQQRIGRTEKRKPT
jgi:hypothetical protein